MDMLDWLIAEHPLRQRMYWGQPLLLTCAAILCINAVCISNSGWAAVQLTVPGFFLAAMFAVGTVMKMRAHLHATYLALHVRLIPTSGVRHCLEVLCCRALSLLAVKVALLLFGVTTAVVALALCACHQCCPQSSR